MRAVSSKLDPLHLPQSARPGQRIGTDGGGAWWHAGDANAFVEIFLDQNHSWMEHREARATVPPAHKMVRYSISGQGLVSIGRSKGKHVEATVGASAINRTVADSSDYGVSGTEFWSKQMTFFSPTR